MSVHTLFWILPFVAGIFYALQGALLARYSRSLDGLSVAVYRNISFIVVMSPLLFLSGKSGIFSVMEVAPFVLASGFFGAIGLSFALSSQRFLPIGVSSALGQFSPLMLLGWSFLFFGETVSATQFLLLCIAIFGGIILISLRHTYHHLHANTAKGVVFILLAVFFGSFGFFWMATAAKRADGFAVAYFWEVSVGIFAFFLAVGRHLLFGVSIKKIRRRTFLRLVLAASPTLVASTAIAFSMQSGNAGIVLAISGSTTVISMLFLGIILYREHLRWKQIPPLLLLLVSIFFLRTV